MAMRIRVQPQRKTPTVEVGIAGLRVPVDSHIAVAVRRSPGGGTTVEAGLPT
jgi:hypothetical protein